MNLLLFALALNLEFLLLSALPINNERKNQFKPVHIVHAHELPNSDLFDFVEPLIPGSKAIKLPVQRTLHQLIPILKVSLSPFAQVLQYLKHKLYFTCIFQTLPDVLEKLTPTELRRAVAGEGEISDKQLLRWGRKMLSEGRDFARQAKAKALYSLSRCLYNKLSLLDIDFQDSHREHSKDAIGKNHDLQVPCVHINMNSLNFLNRF